MTRATIIGLGAMGLAMARNIMGTGIALTGYDIAEPARAAFAKAGGTSAPNEAEAAAGADLLLVMVATADQARTALFDHGAAKALGANAVVVLCSTISPDDARAIAAELTGMGHLMLDAPVSGGQVGAVAGSLTIMASGPKPAFDRASALLDAVAKKVHYLGTKNGIGATYKVVHQLAAGVHLVAAAELMAFGVRAGCDAERLFDIVSSSAGQSWMMDDRAPRMMQPDPAITSTVDIFLKDLGLVLETGRGNGMDLPLSQAAYAMLQKAGEMGLGRADDSAVVRAYTQQSGVPVAKKETG